MVTVRVIVSPPEPAGGRTVRAGDERLGMAYGLADVVEFLRRAGLEGMDAEDERSSSLIEWRGGGPDVWTGEAPGG
ncbi:hypothetical protein ACIQGT_14165 [Streptomyces sp. NPDC093108]|uniref:hypothetical protein n=1 Tax=unclassified Streptomyces TaxID=2593676 RepID=UPI0038036A50